MIMLFVMGEELNSCKNSKYDQRNNEKVFSLLSGGRRLFKLFI